MKEQSVDLQSAWTVTQTRFGFMRLMRLLGMIEIRKTDDSDLKRIVGQACPEQKALPGSRSAWGGWRRNVLKHMFVNQGYPARCRRERVRSQSPHSSVEAANHRGAKEDRKVET
jgi:hypothetical protein